MRIIYSSKNKLNQGGNRWEPSLIVQALIHNAIVKLNVYVVVSTTQTK